MTALSLLREAVIRRDGQCVIALLDHGHWPCQDQWGRSHPANDLSKLTLGHVREHPGGMRRDDEGWCIAQCGSSNLAHDESRMASEVRAYLAGIRVMQGRIEARSGL